MAVLQKARNPPPNSAVNLRASKVSMTKLLIMRDGGRPSQLSPEIERKGFKLGAKIFHVLFTNCDKKPKSLVLQARPICECATAGNLSSGAE